VGRQAAIADKINYQSQAKKLGFFICFVIIKAEIAARAAICKES
jgi:hypothetical protein